MICAVIGRGAATKTFVTDVGSGTVSGTITLADTAIGTAAGDRAVVLVIGYLNTNAITAVTIGGIAATQAVASPQRAGDRCEVWLATVPTGTLADIVITNTGSTSFLRCGVYNANGLSSLTATDTATSIVDPSALNLNVTGQGVAFGGTFSGGPSTNTWTGFVRDYTGSATFGYSGASYSTAVDQTPLTVSVSATGTNTAAAAAAFR